MSETSSSPKSEAKNNLTKEYQVTMRLIKLVDETKYNMIQENGQRRLTSPEFDMNKLERVRGAEIFIGRLPRDCYEDELMPLLQKVDHLLELRLMLDFSGSTRGYAFALFKDCKTARKACEILNNYEIRPGHKIGVVKSVDNCRLFFGGVPKDMTKTEFFEDLNKLLDGVVDIHVYPNAENRNLNRGFIFVEFKDHRSAAMARRNLIPGKVLLWEHEIAVDWAEPEPGDPIDEDLMETVSALFIRNFTLETTQHQIKDILQKATKIPILKLKKINHFAFVHYETRESAEKVLQAITKTDGVANKYGWEVCWAKPVNSFKKSERQRCIMEAFSKNQQKSNQSPQKKQGNLKQEIEKYNGFQHNSLDLPMMAALNYFVMEKLQGHCYYDILQSSEPFGYICKVFIVKDQCIYFEHYGNLMHSKVEAIEATAQVVYNLLVCHIHNLNPMSPMPMPCNAKVWEIPQYNTQYQY